MNRAEKTKKYLEERLRDFQGFEQLRNTKTEFFDSVVHFKTSIIGELRKFKTIDENDIIDIEQRLNSLEKHRSQGGAGTQVYWNGTNPDYASVQTKIYELIALASNTKVPIFIIIWDLTKEAIFTPVFMGSLILVIIAAVLAIVLKY
ncbi:MAG: hypothetical protein GY855_12300 [candidate division Zixibacteria bacterium]|nr:hypothetical protein [candidate division Zixibacteria bacterium]